MNKIPALGAVPRDSSRDPPPSDAEGFKPFAIEIQERFGEGGFWTITSNELPGLFLGGQDLAALRKDLPAAIELLFRLNYKLDITAEVWAPR